MPVAAIPSGTPQKASQADGQQLLSQPVQGRLDAHGLFGAGPPLARSIVPELFLVDAGNPFQSRLGEDARGGHR